MCNIFIPILYQALQNTSAATTSQTTPWYHKVCKISNMLKLNHVNTNMLKQISLSLIFETTESLLSFKNHQAHLQVKTSLVIGAVNHKPNWTVVKSVHQCCVVVCFLFCHIYCTWNCILGKFKHYKIKKILWKIKFCPINKVYVILMNGCLLHRRMKIVK